MHSCMPHFDHALMVAHAFATKLTMYLSLIILSALAMEFHQQSYNRTGCIIYHIVAVSNNYSQQ